MRARLWVVALASSAMVMAAGCGAHPDFVGAARCASCHAREYAAWKGSQHALAMQDAKPGAILARFDGSRLSLDGVVSTFFRRDNHYVVNTQGSDGANHDFSVRYTFGVYPLQQYVVELSRGRMQALPLAWDSRPATQGGQRWFSLDSGYHSAPGDEPHWTGRYPNWNHMCADCHSTAVRKNYIAATDSFHTVWSEIDVACEACHGPGGRHADWARYPAWARRLVWRDDGIVNRLRERAGVRWTLAPGTTTAYRSAARATDHEIETCAQCHARRVHIADGYTAGANFHDYYAPQLLVADLYFPDGQQRNEVYTYGSFLQSKMYAAGVTCSDCHEPHSAWPRVAGNALCAQCHSAAVYDRPAHHFHKQGGTGAQCVACHMPDTTYMLIDRRHDHSMRIPRPDLSVSLGVPNACNRCHTDRSASWAAKAVSGWYHHTPAGYQRFAGAFATDERGAVGAADSLGAVANDSTEPAIARASALARLGAHPGAVAIAAARRWVHDPSPLVRHAALQSLEGALPRDRAPIAAPLLSDPVRSVRLEAAWLLAPAADSLGADARTAFAAAATEFVASQRYNGDRADSRLTLGAFYAARGRNDSAAVEFRRAVMLAPHDDQGYLDLAVLAAARGREAEAQQVLRQGLAAIPDDAALWESLGLSLVRAHRVDEGITALARAAALAPADSAIARTYRAVVANAARLR